MSYPSYPGAGGGAYPGGGGGVYPGGAGTAYPGSGPVPNSGGYPNQYSGGQSGYMVGDPSYRPPVRPEVLQWFQAVDSDRSGHISAEELQSALVNSNGSRFTEDACRLMIALFDKDKSGKIDVMEFQQLFDYIIQWRRIFDSYDRDRSGSIEAAELHQAFQQMGYRFSPQFVQQLLAKFDPRAGSRLSADSFIVSCVQIQKFTDFFRQRDREMKGVITITYEDFLTAMLAV